jgi:hypothetical protein
LWGAGDACADAEYVADAHSAADTASAITGSADADTDTDADRPDAASDAHAMCILHTGARWWRAGVFTRRCSLLRELRRE